MGDKTPRGFGWVELLMFVALAAGGFINSLTVAELKHQIGNLHQRIYQLEIQQLKNNAPSGTLVISVNRPEAGFEF